jgi:ankyrin repeat protein
MTSLSQAYRPTLGFSPQLLRLGLPDRLGLTNHVHHPNFIVTTTACCGVVPIPILASDRWLRRGFRTLVSILLVDRLSEFSLHVGFKKLTFFVFRFLEHGANPNADPQLMASAIDVGGKQLVEKMVQYGGDVFQTIGDRRTKSYTCLHKAGMRGDVELFKYLLHKGRSNHLPDPELFAPGVLSLQKNDL